MKRIRCLIAFIALLAAAPSFAAGLKVTVSPVGGVYGMFARPIPGNGGRLAEAVPIRVGLSGGHSGAVSVTLTAADIFGRPVDWRRRFRVDLPADGGGVDRDLPFDAGVGYYSIRASAWDGKTSQVARTVIGIVPPNHPGIRKDSFFASNTSSLRTGDELAFLRMIGMKVERAHFQPRVIPSSDDWLSRPSTGEALALDFSEQDKALAETKAHDMWVLPIVGYAFQNWGQSAKSDMAHKLAMHGPPRDFREFVNTWETILRHYPEVTTYEFWNEPWIFGWTWAAPPSEYREFQRMWCEMALKVNPSHRIVAGNSSMFVTDNIEQDPSCWKGLLQGTTHHPYMGCGNSNLRSGEQCRSIDDGMLATRRMGLPYYYLTEGGSQCSPDDGLDNADKIVEYYVRAALIGCFQGNAQWGIGYGPTWTRSNVAFAVMTHFLEDRPVIADIWPEHELIYGAIFANPKHVTREIRALPRARELSARWSVPVPADRSDDRTKVAVIWSLTGKSSDRLDNGGTLTIDGADKLDLRAYDMSGRELPRSGASLTVPFTRHPVYITTEKLSAIDLRGIIAGAEIRSVQAMNLYALSLREPADRPQTLFIRVENQLNRDVSGHLRLDVGGQTGGSVAGFTIGSGKLETVAVPWPVTQVSPDNRYAVRLSAVVDRPVGVSRVSRDQAVSVARFEKRMIAVDGDLSDWRGVTPVLLDSEMLKQGVDLTKYLLNPNLRRPTGTPGHERIVARVYAAYDDSNVYLAVAVNEDSLKCAAGAPVEMGNPKVALPYLRGTPNGPDHIANCGDVLSFAFGFRDRVPGWGRQIDDPYAWKGYFCDTDYQYFAHASAQGDTLVRQWGPDMPRRNAYQAEDVPGVGPVDGSAIKIVRDEPQRLTVYEIAIPRTELSLFDPSKRSCRFGFLIYNDEGLGALDWSESAGVFDYWRNPGSYSPTWMSSLPCETVFGIEQ